MSIKYKAVKYVLGMFICMSSTSGFSQTELKSKIVDFMTFAPIESASIYVQNSTVGTVSNADGKFVLVIPKKLENDTLVVSSIGYKSFKTAIQDFDFTQDIFLEEDVASLDEVLIVADTRPKTGNDIVLRAIERLPRTLPEEPYLQKAFLRHRERNKNEYKWLIESALTVYDSSYASGAKKNLKINVDETRKSYDLRDIDSLFTYYSYLKNNVRDITLKSRKLDRDTIATNSLVKAIKWNDERINGMDNLFKGKLNLVRNSVASSSLFGEDMLTNHQFTLDTILVDNGRKLYKIKISAGEDFVGLNTEGMYNEGFEPEGWLYIYWDNYAFKKIEYELVAASEVQKKRSKSLFGTQLNHKLVISYTEYNEKMYPNYIYYETPKLVNIGDRSSDQEEKTAEELRREKEEQFYYTIQEILFTETITDPEIVNSALTAEWSNDIFKVRPYNKEFWNTYNVLLESEEEEKLIKDLSRRAGLFKE